MIKYPSFPGLANYPPLGLNPLASALIQLSQQYGTSVGKGLEVGNVTGQAQRERDLKTVFALMDVEEKERQFARQKEMLLEEIESREKIAAESEAGLTARAKMMFAGKGDTFLDYEEQRAKLTALITTKRNIPLEEWLMMSPEEQSLYEDSIDEKGNRIKKLTPKGEKEMLKIISRLEGVQKELYPGLTRAAERNVPKEESILDRIRKNIEEKKKKGI